MDSADDRTITVSEETARLIREKLDEGSFASASDVVEAGLAALEREQRYRAEDLAWVKAQIRASVEDLGPGHSSEEMREHFRKLYERASDEQLASVKARIQVSIDGPRPPVPLKEAFARVLGRLERR